MGGDLGIAHVHQIFSCGCGGQQYVDTYMLYIFIEYSGRINENGDFLFKKDGIGGGRLISHQIPSFMFKFWVAFMYKPLINSKDKSKSWSIFVKWIFKNLWLNWTWKGTLHMLIASFTSIQRRWVVFTGSVSYWPSLKSIYHNVELLLNFGLIIFQQDNT